jgi:hypothetical protein
MAVITVIFTIYISCMSKIAPPRGNSEQKEPVILHLIHSGQIGGNQLAWRRRRRSVPLEIRRNAAYLMKVDIGSFYLCILITNINGIIVY